MELIWLEDYLKLCRTGNFSGAAETRNLTQPAFSRRIRALAHDRLIACGAPSLMAGQVVSLTEAPLLAYGAGSGLGRILRGVIGTRLPRLLAAPALTADIARAVP